MSHSHSSLSEHDIRHNFARFAVRLHIPSLLLLARDDRPISPESQMSGLFRLIIQSLLAFLTFKEVLFQRNVFFPIAFRCSASWADGLRRQLIWYHSRSITWRTSASSFPVFQDELLISQSAVFRRTLSYDVRVLRPDWRRSASPQSRQSCQRRKIHVYPIVHDWFFDMLDERRTERRWSMRRRLCKIWRMCPGEFNGSDRTLPVAGNGVRHQKLRSVGKVCYPQQRWHDEKAHPADDRRPAP